MKRTATKRHPLSQFSMSSEEYDRRRLAYLEERDAALCADYDRGVRGEAQCMAAEERQWQRENAARSAI